MDELAEHWTRRGMLRASVGAAAALSIGTVGQSAVRGDRGTGAKGVIDVHAHYLPDKYYELRNREEPHFPLMLEDRLKAMDQAGVIRQVLSAAAPPYYDDKVKARDIAQMVNDELVKVVRDHPQRFSFWAGLPLPHMDEALAELRRAMDDLGAAGITVCCYCLGKSIASDEFTPLYEELNRRHAAVFIHPTADGLGSPLILDWGLRGPVGATVDDTIIASHLIVKQIPHSFPNIRFIIPHYGGEIPMLMSRLDGQLPYKNLPELPSQTAKRFYYDTVGWGSDIALYAAIKAFGADHLLPGSDYPVLLNYQPYHETFDCISRSGIPADQADLILRGNAQKLLSL